MGEASVSAQYGGEVGECGVGGTVKMKERRQAVERQAWQRARARLPSFARNNDPRARPLSSPRGHSGGPNDAPLSLYPTLLPPNSKNPSDALGFATTYTPTMAAAVVDVDYLAASYSVPETSIQSLLSAPTVELVQTLLAQIEAKAREYDDIRSEKLRSEVELEAAVHNADTRARTLKATADKAVKDAEELRQKLAHEGECSLRD
jgi:hypothetical protein